MKTTIRRLSALCLVICMLVPSALATAPQQHKMAPPNTKSLHGDNLVTYYDSDGNFAIEETIKACDIQISAPDVIGTFSVNNRTYTSSRNSIDGVSYYLSGDFEWEAGNYIECYGYRSGITALPPAAGWTAGDAKVTTLYGASGQWVRLRYEGTARTPAGVTRTFSTSIEVTRTGVVIYGF